ncbi:ChaN family lipoprotein [Bacteroidota bacterium]
MKKQLFPVLFLTLVLLSFAGDKPAYTLFDKEGNNTKYSEMLKALKDADIIFFGELHTDPIAHWMQIELTRDLYEMKKEALILGAEMFEADNQLILDEYLSGVYPTEKYEAEMRLWKNYVTDYKPLVEFAKDSGIPFVASNIPRRYASVVFQKGFEALDSLTDEAKKYIAPLPINYDPELKCYKDMLNMGSLVDSKKDDENESMKKQGMPGMPGMEAETQKDDKKKERKKKEKSKKDEPVMGSPVHGSVNSTISLENLPKAQAVKDATMAHFILENWTEGKTLFHLNGSYHSNNFQGIVWHLLQENPDLKIITIATVLQENIASVSEENMNIADFIICVPESMTRTSR